MRQIAILLLIGLSVHPIFSQNKVLKDDTLTVLVSKPSTQFEFKDLPYYELDNFQQYRPFGRRRLPIARSGNLGLPTHRYNSSFQDWNMNSLLGAYQMYLFQKDSLRYYKMSRPFTQLSYVTGAEEEQQFQVFHSQNLGEGMNLAFEYQRMTSTGFYIRQLTNHTQFNTTINLKSRDERFSSRAYFLINNLQSQENGGIFISDDDETDNTIELDINLRDAQNHSRTQGVGARNEFNFLQSDSTGEVWFNLSHEINWEKAYRIYSDDVLESPDFYDLYIWDERISFDSSFSQTFSNTVLANLLGRKVNIGFRNEQIHYYQNALIDEDFNSNFLLAELNGNVFGQALRVDIEKGISGFHKEELDIDASIDFKEFQKVKTALRVHLTQKRADYLLLNQRANHHYFNYDFSTSDQLHVQAKAAISKWKLKVDVGLKVFNNYIYFDSLVTPQQHEDQINSLYASIQKDFKFLNNWNLRNNILVQTFSDEEIIPLPNITSYHSFFYENTVFKNALTFQAGADLYFIGEYRGYMYSPSLAQFHLRNSDKVLGNTYQVDLFLNLRINKSARVFFKMENITANSFSESTFRIQDYPIPGRAFKVGLSWRMVN